MKILFVAPYVLYAMRSRPYHLLRHLSRRHAITVACIVQPAWAAQYLEDIRPFCEEIHTVGLNHFASAAQSLMALPSGKPMSVAYVASRQMKSLVARLAQDGAFDLIHTEFIRAAPYTAGLQGTPKVFDSVDSLALAYARGWRNRHGSLINRIIAYEEWLKMRRYEPEMLRAFDRVIVSSAIDQKFLASTAGPPVEVITNGVDHEYFYWEGRERDENSLVFVGGMNYYVNVDSVLNFYRHIFPRIRRRLPEARFSIVGAVPKKSIRNLAKDPAVEVTGTVPDIRPYLTRAAVFVCPLLAGSGVQNKLLQAMAMGTPIVTTSIASQPLQVQDGEHLLVADEPEQFAEAVMCLIKDKGLRQKLSVNARKYVEECHDWDSIGRKLEAIYQSLL
jgi:sugar transferase (PEP-CTERM/EpsH1 system associated)